MRHMLAATALVATIVALTPAPARADAGIDPRIAAVQITMRSRLLYRGPVTGVAGPRTTASIAILQAAARGSGRRGLRAANPGTVVPVRNARARGAAARHRRERVRRCPSARPARAPRFPVGAILECVHATRRAGGASVPALRRPTDDRNGRAAHGQGASRCAHGRRRGTSPGRSHRRSRVDTGSEARASTQESTSSQARGRLSARQGAARWSMRGGATGAGATRS